MSMAIIPEAPGRLSMMTGCPKNSENLDSRGLAMASEPPPAAVVTINRTGLLG